MRVNRVSRSCHVESSSLILTAGIRSFPVHATWMTIVRDCGGASAFVGFGSGICAFSPYSGSIDTTSMNMMINVSKTSISVVTLICGPDGPPPAIEKDIEIAPLGHACLQHQTPRLVFEFPSWCEGSEMRNARRLHISFQEMEQ